MTASNADTLLRAVRGTPRLAVRLVALGVMVVGVSGAPQAAAQDAPPVAGLSAAAPAPVADERPSRTPLGARLLRRFALDPDALVRDAFGWRLRSCTFVNNEASRDEVYGDLLSCLYRQLRVSLRVGSTRATGMILGEFESGPEGAPGDVSAPVPFQILWQPADLRLRDLARPLWRAFIDGRAELPLERLLSRFTLVFPDGAPLERLGADTILGGLSRAALGGGRVTRIELVMDRATQGEAGELRTTRSGRIRFLDGEDPLAQAAFRTDWDPLAGATTSFFEVEVE